VIEVDVVLGLATALDGAELGTWYGAPAVRVDGKVFVRVHENDDDLVLLKVGPDERDALVADDRERWSCTEHRSERDDSVLMRRSRTATEDLPELRELVEEAHRRVSGRA
jgi:hypothetical protein